MGLNRMMIKSQAKGKDAFTITMGNSGIQYGYSRYYATIGEVEGEVMHNGKAVTLKMLCYYSGYLDFAFNVDGVTTGKYNVTIEITEVDTGRAGRYAFGDMPYESRIPGFYLSPDNIPTDVSRFFVAANVDKKYTVKLIFN